ncbi:MAG: hypothetical protein U0M42_00140 [Acutalibacteraceae bacterium]|nr:hypothetical protein [Acutalibacteraceae bacterium]
MNSLKNKNSFFDKVMATTLFEIFAVLYIAHKLLPVFGYYMPSVVYLGVFAATFVFGLCISTKGEKQNFTLSMLPVFLTSVLACIRYVTLGNISGMFVYVYGELQIYLYGIIAVWYIVKNRPERAKFIFNFMLVCYAITGVTTYIGCIKYPQASRIMATLSTYDSLHQLYTRNNIGGFTFIYELILIMPLLIYMIKDKKINRLLGVIGVALIGLVVIQSEYATALILYVVTLILFLIPRLTGGKVFLFVVLALLIIISLKTFIAGAFESLSNTVESETLAERFQYIADLLSGRSVDSADNNRMELYAKSLNTFFDTAMFGGWNNAVTSGHSFVLDIMAIYGIIGLFAIIAAYIAMYKVFIGRYKDRPYYAYLVYAYILGILMAVVNTKMNLFIFICFIPTFAFVMDNKYVKEKTSENFMGSK